MSLRRKRLQPGKSINRKRDYIVSKLDETKDNPKHFWKEIDQNLSFGKPKSTNYPCNRIRPADGHKVTGDDVKTLFNNFYVSVEQTLADKFHSQINP